MTPKKGQNRPQKGPKKGPKMAKNGQKSRCTKKTRFPVGSDLKSARRKKGASSFSFKLGKNTKMSEKQLVN